MNAKILLATKLFIIVTLSHVSASDFSFIKKIETGAYNSALLQDSDDFIWIGTTKGLVKFDGYEQVVFKKSGKNSPSANQISSVFEDSRGLIWFSLHSNGVNCYDKKTGLFANYTHDPTKKSSLSSNNNTWSNKLFAEDSKGTLWYGSADGLNYYNHETDTFSSYTLKGISDTLKIWSIYTDQSDKIWIGTDQHGLIVLDPQTGDYQLYSNDPGDPKSLGSGRVYCVIQDKEGLYWVGTSEGGLCLFNKSDSSFTRFTHDKSDPYSFANNCIYEIHEDQSGLLWTCGYYSHPSGVEVFDKKQQKVIQHLTSNSKVPDSISGDVIMSIHRDNSGGMWLVENMGSINYYNPAALPIRNYTKGTTKADLTSNSIMSIFEDSQNNIWFSFVGGVNCLNIKTGEITFYGKTPQSKLLSDYIFSVLEDRGDRLWFATDDGALNIFNKDEGHVMQRYQNPQIKQVARALTESKVTPGVFWYGTEGSGFVKFDSNTGEFTNYMFDSRYKADFTADNIQYLKQDVNNQEIIWICSKGDGLGEFNQTADTVTFFSHDSLNELSISSNSIGDIHVAKNGRYWVTTDDAGLNEFFPETGTFTRYGKEAGFTATQALNTILEDENGFLWIGSDIGIIKFDTEKEKVVRLYTSSDGLVSESFPLLASAGFKSSDGTMWFSGTKGVSSFKPEEFNDISYAPKLHFTMIKKGLSEWEAASATEKVSLISIDWEENFFEFEVSSLNYISPTNSYYKYKLDGWDDEWIEAKKKRYGRYSRLPGGEYTLRVVSTNSDGTWNNNNESHLKVVVSCPFWQTNWFYWACGAFITFTICLIAAYIRKLNKEVRERKVAEAALQDHRKNLQITLNSIADAVISTNKQGLVVQMNPVAEKLTGWTLEYALMENIDTVFKTVEKNNTPPLTFNKVISGEYDISGEFDAQLISRRELQYEIHHSTSIIKDSDNNIAGMVVVFRDMTEHNAITERLKDSQRMDSIGQLAGGIAHDFNNMLQGILGYSDMLVRKITDNEKHKRYADQIYKTAERASDLTGKLLSFSRRGKEVTAPIDLHHEILEAGLILERSIDKRISIKYDLNAVNDHIVGDPTELHNAILNISINARDAMPDGGTLTFDTENVIIDNETLKQFGLPCDKHNFIRISISDTGIGMSEHITNKIFEPFFTTKEVGEGTGLGLSAVYGTLKDHHGEIIVESEEGHGTTFHLYLPIQEQEVRPVFEKNIERVTKPLNILVIDDEKVVRDYLSDLLTEMGHSVVQASDGEKGMEKFRLSKDQLELVIVDMVMPHITGAECFKQISSIAPDMDVIMCSGYTRTPGVEKLLSQGLNAFIRKPFSRKEITETIQSVCGL